MNKNIIKLGGTYQHQDGFEMVRINAFIGKKNPRTDQKTLAVQVSALTGYIETQKWIDLDTFKQQYRPLIPS